MKIHHLTGIPILALGACAYEPTPLPVISALQNFSNTTVISPISYQNPLAGYVYRSPTAPRDWRTVNEEQTEGR